MELNRIIPGDSLEVLKTLPDSSVDCCVTSPPYWGLRDYGVNGQLGLEPDFRDYITKLAYIFDEVKRVLKSTGTCWVNLGDTYAGSWKGIGSDHGIASFTDRDIKKTDWKSLNLPPKSLVQIPSRFALAMSDRGWILRNEIIWHKPNAMPSSVKDRFTVDFEKLFFFTKSKKYWFEQQQEPSLTPGSIHRHKNPGKMSEIAKTINPTVPQKDYVTPDNRNKRSVWAISTKPYPSAHFATFPPELVEIPIKAGCPPFGVVLDPFMGSGTTAFVARKLIRNYIGIELNPEYIKLAEKRFSEAEPESQTLFA